MFTATMFFFGSDSLVATACEFECIQIRSCSALLAWAMWFVLCEEVSRVFGGRLVVISIITFVEHHPLYSSAWHGLAHCWRQSRPLLSCMSMCVCGTCSLGGGLNSSVTCLYVRQSDCHTFDMSWGGGPLTVYPRGTHTLLVVLTI